jgi:SAM-dependent methyltransferase
MHRGYPTAASAAVAAPRSGTPFSSGGVARRFRRVVNRFADSGAGCAVGERGLIGIAPGLARPYRRAMPVAAAYDQYADWYEAFVQDSWTYMDRVRGLLADLLGPGTGRCLDLCCGGGAHAATIASRGWAPIGVDLSLGQLRHAQGRLSVLAGDASRLPLRSGSLPAVACVLAHTDVPDYAKMIGEVARVLQSGGRFVHVGPHPCFTGAFADWSQPDRVVVDTRYAERGRAFTGPPEGVRVRVGAWHVPLADLLNAFLEAGLHIDLTAESTANGIADVFAVRAVKSA